MARVTAVNLTARASTIVLLVVVLTSACCTASFLDTVRSSLKNAKNSATNAVETGASAAADAANDGAAAVNAYASDAFDSAKNKAGAAANAAKDAVGRGTSAAADVAGDGADVVKSYAGDAYAAAKERADAAAAVAKDMASQKFDEAKAEALKTARNVQEQLKSVAETGVEAATTGAEYAAVAANATKTAALLGGAHADDVMLLRSLRGLLILAGVIGGAAVIRHLKPVDKHVKDPDVGEESDENESSDKSDEKLGVERKKPSKAHDPEENFPMGAHEVKERMRKTAEQIEADLAADDAMGLTDRQTKEPQTRVQKLKHRAHEVVDDAKSKAKHHVTKSSRVDM